MPVLNWNVSAEDAELLGAITEEAWRQRSPEFLAGGVSYNDLHMDLTATHANGTPLRLADMLAHSDTFDFLHDIYGIINHLDRDTGQLTHHFVPRFAA